MNDFVEPPAVWLVERRERAVGRISESEEVGHEVVFGDSHDRARPLLVTERSALIGRHRNHPGNGGRSRRDVARALPHSRQFAELIRSVMIKKSQGLNCKNAKCPRQDSNLQASLVMASKGALTWCYSAIWHHL